jgi:hypothetical protein
MSEEFKDKEFKQSYLPESDENSPFELVNGQWVLTKPFISNGFVLDPNGTKLKMNDLEMTQDGIRLKGTNLFRASVLGIWLGSANFNTAPFRVDINGNLVATSAFINGTSMNNEGYFGDGSDGDVTISADTTLASDMYYNNLTVDATKTLNANGFRIFVLGTLTNNGTISNVGNPGVNGSGQTSDGTGGAATGSAVGFFFRAQAGQAGGNGGAVANGNGLVGGGGFTINGSYCTTNGAVGGAGASVGGGGNGGAAGAAGTSTQAITKTKILHELISFQDFSANLGGGYYALPLQPGGGSGAGGGGGADGTNPGGKGGGSGSRGGTVLISAKVIVNNGTISVKGGAGGNGAGGAGVAGGGGGGAGGSGGVIVLIYSTYTNTGTLDVSGGAKGTGGVGASATGSDGNAGLDGTVVTLEL